MLHYNCASCSNLFFRFHRFCFGPFGIYTNRSAIHLCRLIRTNSDVIFFAWLLLWDCFRSGFFVLYRDCPGCFFRKAAACGILYLISCCLDGLFSPSNRKTFGFRFQFRQAGLLRLNQKIFFQAAAVIASETDNYFSLSHLNIILIRNLILASVHSPACPVNNLQPRLPASSAIHHPLCWKLYILNPVNALLFWDFAAAALFHSGAVFLQSGFLK